MPPTSRARSRAPGHDATHDLTHPQCLLEDIPVRTPPPSNTLPLRTTRSTCPYCGVGCGVLIDSVGERIVGVRGDPDHPANRGRLCTKGSTLHHTADPTISAQVRLLQPMRRDRRGSAPQPLRWDQALDWAANRLAEIVCRHGPDAVGFYISGQLLTEDYYVFNKLAKGLLGTNNIDTNSRLCMSSAVAAYKLTLGADAPPACYADIDHAHCLFIAGSNTAWAHPVLFRRIEAAKARRPEMRIIVADPRRTDTASLADLYLPLQPGTDVMLFHGLLHIMLTEGWVDSTYIEQHTTGFAELRQLVQSYTPATVAQVCGLSPDNLYTAARWFAGVPDGKPATSLPSAQRLPTLSLYCQGLNQSSSGTDKNACLINLHLACGQIGRPGAGPFSLTGQPNAMGGREVGGLANLLSAHRDLSNPAHRAEMAALWQLLPGTDLPALPGKTAVEMFEAAADGQIKALWIACTNPAQSMPDQATVRRALQRAELVIVQEAFATSATCDWADLLLPATTWGEKEGTVTNSERCISRVRAAVPPPRAADGTGPRHDWHIVVDLARRLEQRLPRRSHSTLFPYDNPQAIWNEHRESTRGRDLDITGLSYTILETAPQQWPFPEGRSTGTPRLYEDGRFPTADGRARFVTSPYRPPAEDRSARYPYAMTTGRLRDQWHGMSRTGTLGTLFGHVHEPQVWMHPQDMAESGLKPGQLVRVQSARGSLVLPAHPSHELHRRQCFVPMHWGSEHIGGRSDEGTALAGVNGLTTSAFCPQAKQPELKHTAVRIDPVHLPWTVQALAWLPAHSALLTLRQLRPLLTQFDYAVCVPFAPPSAQAPASNTPVGLWFQAAHAQTPEPTLSWLEPLCAALQLDHPETLRYDDAPRQQHRRIRLTGPEGRHLQSFLFSGDSRSATWLSHLLRDTTPCPFTGPILLQSLQNPPGKLPVQRGKTICNCLGVTEAAILDCLAGLDCAVSEHLHILQTRLGCGTQCGSCLPELKRLTHQHSNNLSI